MQTLWFFSRKDCCTLVLPQYPDISPGYDIILTPVKDEGCLFFFGKTIFASTIHVERPQALAKPYYVVGFKSLSEKVLEMVPGCSVAFVQKLARENIPKSKRPQAKNSVINYCLHLHGYTPPSIMTSVARVVAS